MSTLKHNIRQQQAQLNNLENIVRSGPRPYGPELTDDSYMAASSASTSTTPPSSYSVPAPTSTKMKRRSSHDVLSNLAGPDSSLPLPRRDTEEDNSIREGIPSPSHYKRPSSPSRTLSRKLVDSLFRLY